MANMRWIVTVKPYDGEVFTIEGFGAYQNFESRKSAEEARDEILKVGRIPPNIESAYVSLSLVYP